MYGPEDKKPLPPELQTRKKTYERGLVILAVLSLILLIAVQRELLNLGPGLSSNQGVITLVSINMSVFILGLLLFLILRGLYRIFFEQRNYGSLQTKMVVSFISLSLMPTILIFYFSYLLIGQDQETWFSASIRDTLDDALTLSESAQALEQRLARSDLRLFSLEMKNSFFEDSPSPVQAAPDAPPRSPETEAPPDGAPPEETAAPAELDPAEDAERPENADDRTAPAPRLDKPRLDKPRLLSLLEEGRLRYDWTIVELYDREGQLTARVGAAPDEPLIAPAFFAENFRLFAEGRLLGYPAQESEQSSAFPERQVMAVPSENGPFWFLAVESVSQRHIEAKIGEVRTGLEKYQAAFGISRPFRVTQMTSLAGVTLLAVFLSIWIGSHLAGSLAAPVTELVDGTKRVAKGELDFVLTPVHQSGEMAQLVLAFNQMTAELRDSYSEIDRRRRFVETVLKQVSSGVMILDLENRPVNFNQAAKAMLELEEPWEVESERPESLLPLLDQPDRPAKNRTHVFLEVGEKVLSLSVSRAKLRDEEGRDIGSLITFDDISELEKAQRLAAWREVAKRIAHEIKNPLTPISLSAQRLRRRFGQLPETAEEREIFEECFAVIVRQVENMRQLVDEFSQFARLPEINPEPADFIKVVEENTSLFRSAHPDMHFSLRILNRPGVFIFDPKQLGRVVTNLLTNAAAATNGQGKVDLTVDLDETVGVSLSVSDNGPGLKPEVRKRLFKSDVSTFPGEGKGLGLTIVDVIVRDHDGFIRVEDNKPNGAIFKVTIPYRQT
ncbi:MAG: HAMP domain-containing protein [Deltaproteobacteria bacterium]|jgi:two-component system nitrogen regulation sensor histidine kinase NtrY|nr:HAMP domain-containing protein [Deltaproteobacteria bacterium]